jgi:hypothetical protein
MTMTSRTSFRSTAGGIGPDADVILRACADELEKIAKAQQKQSLERKGKLLRFLKNTALVSAGYGLGHGAGMLVERAVTPTLRRHKNYLPALAMVASVGSMLGAARLRKQLEAADV